MSAERVAASSRVRFEVTGRPSLLRNSRGFAAVKTAHAPSQVNRTDPCSGRLLVRPYLPVGVDHLALDPRGAEGPPDHGDLARDEPVGAERGQGRPAGAVPRAAADRVGTGPG